LTAVQTKSWDRLSKARNYQPSDTGIWYNPANPSEARFESVAKWRRTRATPFKTKITVTGEGKATVNVGSPFFPKTATVTGPIVTDYVAGTRFSVWTNPDNSNEFVFEPRVTVPEPKYWMVVLAGLTGVGGITALVLGEGWVDRSQPRPAPPQFANMQFRQGFATQASVVDQLRAIDWFQFEAVAARILESEGWSVQKLGGSNPDGGADLLAIRNGHKAVVQCKHWRSWEVKPGTLRELLGTQSSARFAASGAILFTLSECTEAALAFARENGIAIYNSSKIEAAIKHLGIGRFPELTNPNDKRCPKCGAAMVLRENVPTPFWGCTTFPKCRGTIERA
jgi:hypothetical protein